MYMEWRDMGWIRDTHMGWNRDTHMGWIRDTRGVE